MRDLEFLGYVDEIGIRALLNRARIAHQPGREFDIDIPRGTLRFFEEWKVVRDGVEVDRGRDRERMRPGLESRRARAAFEREVEVFQAERGLGRWRESHHAEHGRGQDHRDALHRPALRLSSARPWACFFLPCFFLPCFYLPCFFLLDSLRTHLPFCLTLPFAHSTRLPGPLKDAEAGFWSFGVDTGP